ncbi:neutral/alkaline non-lysosomal ceramidase N-terminal domain-containing protein [Hydrocarboniphaga sp.]|uniref:neutral/alkaline non-lysosomal ceramidase N-terminal domain-containing protein n=1 Tax=Hydrocarboniphaga sp. TaxID=2033016 RepID=UPI003D11BB46
MSLLAGAAREEIVVSGRGFGMLGYGRTEHKVLGAATKLYSRAFCFDDGRDAGALFFAQAEICMVFPELRRAIVERVRQAIGMETLRSERFMFTSQHTHCGPGGYSHYPFYNFSIPGFRRDVFDAIVNSVSDALVGAWNARASAQLQFAVDRFADDVDVAFNRSLAAYNRNPEVARLGDHQTHLAVDRRMWLLKVSKSDGALIGQINWFGVHPTSISSKVSLLSYDNKGYAADYLEQQMGAGTVAIFAQHFAGDVSPNAQGNTRPDWPRGKFKDEHASAEYNGQLQCAQAWKMIQAMGPSDALPADQLDAALVNRDFTNIEVDADFADGLRGERTTPPCHGLAFYEGSPIDGPGIRQPITGLVGFLAKLATRRVLRKARRDGETALAAAQQLYRAQQPKIVVTQSADGILLGLRDRQKLPGLMDPMLAEMQRQDRAGALDAGPWVPVVLPLQFMRIGELAIIGFPGEITTVAGLQLQALSLEVLAPAGVRKVVIASYANSYFGYCTTWHEYQQQQYEGGHTTFGSRTHDAFRTEFRRLLRECVKPAAARELRSEDETIFSPETLALRSAR